MPTYPIRLAAVPFHEQMFGGHFVLGSFFFFFLSIPAVDNQMKTDWAP